MSIIHNGSEKMQKNKKCNNKTKMLVVVNILLLIIAIILIVLLRYNYKIEKTSVVVTKEKRDLKYENIVFLGDSITDWYPFEEMYDSKIPIVNSGIAGYETTDILKKLDEMVYQYNPTKVFILIGTNDLKYSDDDEEQVVENIKKIIEGIKENRPNTEIYLESIFPINREIKYHAVEERYNDEIKEVNNKLKKYCSKNKVTYIDMYDEFSDDKGNFDKEYTKDGLHPSEKGYIKLTSILLKYIY